MARNQQKISAPTMGVYIDHQRRTCLLVEDGEQVKYIPLDISDGIQLHETTKASFIQRYTCLPNYPIKRAAQLYLNYCLTIGTTDEVLDQLAKVISITKEEYEVATSKRATKPVKQEPEKAAKKTVAKKTAVKKTESAKYTSAAQMFQELIMAGRLTDDKIFEKVQAEFGLDDSKRGYVTWYRNKLRKAGQNPPDAK